MCGVTKVETVRIRLTFAERFKIRDEKLLSSAGLVFSSSKVGGWHRFYRNENNKNKVKEVVKYEV